MLIYTPIPPNKIAQKKINPSGIRVVLYPFEDLYLSLAITIKENIFISNKIIINIFPESVVNNSIL
jgi:hypothetical protein